MSLDFQLGWQCPHLTIEEVVELGDDRMSLPVLQPIGSGNVIRLLANNEVVIPPGGLYVPAKIYSTDSGPFDLLRGQDTLTVETGSGSQTFVFGVTTLTRKTTDEIVSFLMRSGLNVALVENINGHLLFTDITTVGQESFVRISGTASSVLGFGDPKCGVQRQYGARGRMIYPGWVLQRRPDTIVNRYIKFIQPVRMNPTFKATYITPVNRCRRCRASYVENDYRFDELGQGILIGNENLLYQAALKILLTDRGSNPYHLWYGTNIRSRIGSKALGNTAALISEDVRLALGNYQQIQRAQVRNGQQTTLKERLYRILDVQTLPHEEDPTTFLLTVTVQNQSTEPISLTVVFTVPEVVAVMGSNGLTLGTEVVGLDPKQLPSVVR